MVLLTILGGILIAISTSTYLYVNGKIAGFSGMLWSVSSQDDNSRSKSLFLLTMMTTNSFIYIVNNFFNFKQDLYDSSSKQTNGLSFFGFLLSGFLVGFGTKLGNGCTSGHGVCGLPRLSKRSWVFIIIMMISAIITANLKHRFKLFNKEHEIQNDGFMTLMLIVLVFITSLSYLYNKYIKQWNNMVTQYIQQDMSTMFSAVLFTLGLILAGFVKRDKVYNFLVISENWDYSLMIILGVAVGLNMLLFKMILDKKKNYFGEEFQLAKNTNVNRQLIIGAIIFGIGWGISSLCPGPALLLLQFCTFKISIVFTLSMIGGQFVANKIGDLL